MLDAISAVRPSRSRVRGPRVNTEFVLSTAPRSPSFTQRLARWTSICALAGALAGCNLEWNKPDLSTPPPEKFREAGAKSASPIAAGREFVTRFGSRELTGLVELALADNLDIAAAAARITQADAQARIASAQLWPSLWLQDTARTTRTPGTTINLGSAGSGFNPATNSSGASTGSTNTASALRGRAFDFYNMGLNASYEIDFWGRFEDASYAARLLQNASRFDRDVVEIATVASVMNAYFQVVTAQDRLRIARNNVAIAEKVNAAVHARFEVGAASLFDTAQQETVVARQRATIPPFEQTVRQTSNVLAVLLGRTPESIDIKGGTMTKLKFPKIEPGLPSEVLLRRPDIARAEAQLASQEFSVLNARAAFFPSVTLTGQYGLQTALLRNLLRPEAIAWQAAAGLAQPLLDGYNLQGQYYLQQGRYAELAALYRKQIISALSDVENALIAIKETGLQLKLQGEAVAAARRAFDAAEMRMQEGTIDIITLSVTQNDYFTAQEQEVVVRLNYFQAATSLYQALGGGWSPTTRDAEIAHANSAYDSEKGPWP
jgi:NodT family efflux transporter outer membrane factor (OMF) lipoprotein